MDNISNINWVPKRAACSLEKVFKELELGAQADVKEIQPYSKRTYQIVSIRSDAFSVVDVTGTGPTRSVNFVLEEKEIKIDSLAGTLTAKITLTDEGICKLKLADGTELYQWQFRKRCLEPLFFA